MQLVRVAALFGAAVLGACSGGGSSGNGGGGTVVTPTPSPSTGATPTPSPSPSPSYTKFADLTGDLLFRSTCVGNEAGFSIGWIPTSSPRNGLSFGFSNSAASWTVQGNGEDVTFLASERDTTAPSTVARYIKPGGPTTRLTIQRPGIGTVGADYFRVATYVRSPRTYQCMIGIPTLITDRPAGSTISFPSASVTGYLFITPQNSTVRTQYSTNNSTSMFSVNLDRGEVAYSVRLIGSPLPTGSGADVDFGTITGVASIDPDTGGYYTTQLTVNGLTLMIGEMSGEFYGPQGKEAGFGLAVYGTRPDGGQVSGSLVGIALR
ncbi:MAG: hypothetical protein EON59_10715 [Alphaproteobacteria bacterium]|nr:MAG: hypothetical protein EON59_10715 [Alphaproteobacteria bacterium]